MAEQQQQRSRPLVGKLFYRCCSPNGRNSSPFYDSCYDCLRPLPSFAPRPAGGLRERKDKTSLATRLLFGWSPSFFLSFSVSFSVSFRLLLSSSSCQYAESKSLRSASGESARAAVAGASSSFAIAAEVSFVRTPSNSYQNGCLSLIFFFSREMISPKSQLRSGESWQEKKRELLELSKN